VFRMYCLMHKVLAKPHKTGIKLLLMLLIAISRGAKYSCKPKKVFSLEKKFFKRINQE